MAIRIALVDDSYEDQSLLLQMILNYFKAQNHIPQIDSFSSAEDFLSSFEINIYDIIFLDIYMAGLTGMDAAVAIREKDSDCKLIFLTSSQDFLLEGYSVNASHYLLKPLTQEKLSQALKFCQVDSFIDRPCIFVESKGSRYQIELSKIYYIDIQNRKVYVHLKEHALPVNGSFREITKDLSTNESFLLSIQGVLVNMDKIAGEDKNCFILNNQETVPINIRNRKSIINLYHQYLFHKIRSEDE